MSVDAASITYVQRAKVSDPDRFEFILALSFGTLIAFFLVLAIIDYMRGL